MALGDAMGRTGAVSWMWQEIKRRFDPERPATAEEFVDRPWGAVQRYVATIRHAPAGTVLLFRATQRSGLTSLLAQVGRELAAQHAGEGLLPQTWLGTLNSAEAPHLWEDSKYRRPVPFAVAVLLSPGAWQMREDAKALAIWARAASSVAVCDWGHEPLSSRDARSEQEVEVPDEAPDEAESWFREIFAKRTTDIDAAAAALPEPAMAALVRFSHGHVGNFIALVRASAKIALQRKLLALSPADVRDAAAHIQATLVAASPAALIPAADVDAAAWRLATLEVENFRCFQTFTLDLTAPSVLPGHWRCLCGINGAGKSTALQAVALGLLGRAATDLLRSRLKSMRRHGSGEGVTRVALQLATTGAAATAATAHATVTAVIDPAGELIIEPRTSDEAGAETWRRVQHRLVVGYGANRNLSDLPDSSPPLESVVRRVFSLFEPFAHLPSADALLRASGTPAEAVRDIASLADDLLGEQGLRVEAADGQLRFLSQDVAVDALALPDGFRSTLAWLADLIVQWRLFAGPGAGGRPLEELDALVLIDEIDLHLHPSLQRRLIEVLRRRLPNVQWIVTTHSPLVLASFTRAELVALDVNVDGGIRPLDREILGWSADQVYDWLMATPPRSVAFESVAQVQGLGLDDEQIAQIIQQSPQVSAEDAKAKSARRKELLAKLRAVE